uniref:Protein kinase domain-containing protein n=1 Tax=Gasterosteus aculeatus aculeatus TaxID=481459 RepID=G3PDX9_GASAC|nr:serine/threonine-protein kinase Nek3 isoform X1 [Gasterosteus aculeatus aculeatus]
MERYSLQKVIGEGSFGRALLVRCKSTQEKYVVKEVQLPKNPSKLENSRREAILLSRMKHPHIVAFREAFEADDLLCIVMEYCSAGDLLQRIRQQKTTQFRVEDILRWFAQMCAAAVHIHDKRVLHRDLKSKNIFLTDNGTIKLGDFGSACILNSSKAYAHTYVGTPYYVAPEIWDNKPYNNKSDVWSLGCVLYELCTLRHPFQASSWRSLILKVCRGAYPPLPGRLPYELQYLLKQMFKTNPKDRPSLHSILTSHRVSRLLRAHLPPQALETQEQGRRTGRWNREEGKNVAGLLGEKSLIEMSTCEAEEFAEARCESRRPVPRKRWAAEPSDTARQMLADASLASSDSEPSTDQPEEPEGSRPRRRWEKDPPERLLALLEKARLSRASSTFLIHSGVDDPLVGPLSQPRGDDTDGGEPNVAEDEERLQPRSDDEDTDFEEDSACDWMEEVEKMFSEH